MKVILGLGNPETRYDGTRHNVGFYVADHLARQEATSFNAKSKFKAELAEYSVGGEKVLIAKPTTFYNQVGESLRAIVDFYNLSSDEVLIISDDLALPLGTIRIRASGNHAGNNGIKSILSHNVDGIRLRVGVSTEMREKINDADYVLGRFSKNEQTKIDDQLPVVLEIIADFVSGTLEPSTYTS